MHLQSRLNKILPLIQNGIAGALIFGAALLAFYIEGSFSLVAARTFHVLFYSLGFAAVMILLYFNLNRPVFFFLAAVVSYVLINYLKNKYGAIYPETPAYQNLCFFLPLNLLVFSFLPPQRLLKKNNVYILLAVFAEFALAEQLSLHDVILNFRLFDAFFLDITSAGLFFFLVTLTTIFIQTVRSGNLMDYALFFASLSFFCGFLYSSSASALSCFFAAGAAILTLALVQNIYHEIYRDPLTGLASRNSYIIHAKDFPLKYSIGIVSIDDFDKLSANFGRRTRNILTRLIAEQIIELESSENVYRYGGDEFVIVLRNQDKNEGFDRLEAIRRAVASASYKFHPRRKALKLTVSAAVSEKKRSDANSFEVLVRARKVLAQTRSFSHNVTSKA